MADATQTKSRKSTKVLICAVISVVSIITGATLLATTLKNPATTKELIIDLQGYDDEEFDPNHECKHSEMKGEVVQKMMEVLEGSGNVTAFFHQDDDVAFSFNKDNVEMTEQGLCFGTFDGGKFCFEVDASDLNHRLLEEEDDDDDDYDSSDSDDINEYIFNFDFKLLLDLIMRCNFCPAGFKLYNDGSRAV